MKKRKKEQPPIPGEESSIEKYKKATEIQTLNFIF